MEKFTEKIVSMMKSERLYESQGGPIILSQVGLSAYLFSGQTTHRTIEQKTDGIIFFSLICAQIENEYGPLETNAGDRRYANWAAKMAVGLNTGVPWLMCKQDDAPDPVINTCNGFYCDYFSPDKPYKPKMWTENWTGWYVCMALPNDNSFSSKLF